MVMEAAAKYLKQLKVLRQRKANFYIIINAVRGKTMKTELETRSIILPVFIFATIFTTLVLALPVFADDVEVTLTPEYVLVNTTETEFTIITVHNNRNVEDTFSLTVWPSIKWGGVTPNLEKYLLKVPAESSASTKLYLTAAGDADEVVTNFLVTAKSLNNASVIDSANVKVQILRKTSVYISDVKLDTYVVNPGDSITATVTATNSADADSDPLKLQTNVRTSAEILKRFDDELDEIGGESTKSVQHTYTTGKYLSPATYSVEVILKDSLNRMIDTRSVTFRVERVKNLVQSGSLSYSIFSQIKTITIKNEGNVLEEGFYVTESVPVYVKNFFYPEVEPATIEEKDNRIVYSWYISSLQPGSEATIKYEVRFFSIWLIGLAVIGVVVLAFKYAYTPRIIKKHSLFGKIERGKEIMISLEVRNPTLHEIKNVEVMDLVTPIANVVDKFDTMKPSIKRMDHGTELTWSIRSLRPMEERVLTYRIKPVVEIIGTLMLPKARITYLDRKKRKKDIASKVVIIK